MQDVTIPLDSSPESLSQSLMTTLSQVVRWSSVTTVQVPGLSGTPFIVPHDLGRVPDRMLVLPTRNANIYCMEEDRALWNESTITIRCSHASLSVDVSVGTIQ